jgi:hypothetical protein
MIKSDTEYYLAIDREELFRALEKSVDLQSHYASLLNQYDGGKRLKFRTAYEWLERLRKMKI